MQPTNSTTTDILDNPPTEETKIADAAKNLITILKNCAHDAEDGNTLALINRIERDLNNLLPDYQNKTFGDVVRAREEAKKLEEGLAAQRDNDPQSIQSERSNSWEEDDSFVPQSYEKIGAQDVNVKPTTPTNEDASAPFATKADLKVAKASKVTTSKDV